MEGAGLSDLSKNAQLTRPTTHRILKALAAEGLVMQDGSSRRYHLGHVVHELGLVAFKPIDVAARLRPLLSGLARETRDTVYLMTVSGYDIVCLDRIDGDFPVRAYTFEVGRRSPLGAGAASLVFLARRSDSEIDVILGVNGPALREYGYHTPQELRSKVMQARQRGVGISRGRIAAGVVAVSVLVPNPNSVPFLALTVTAIAGRMPKARIAELTARLRKVSAKASAALLSD
jgi:DNA-binding IclR family transcriptional regulator